MIPVLTAIQANYTSKFPLRKEEKINALTIGLTLDNFVIKFTRSLKKLSAFVGSS